MILWDLANLKIENNTNKRLPPVFTGRREAYKKKIITKKLMGFINLMLARSAKIGLIV